VGNCGKVNGENPNSGQVEKKTVSALLYANVKPPLVKTHSEIALLRNPISTVKSYSGEHAEQALVHSPLSS
jgi:hypothetical protein